MPSWGTHRRFYDMFRQETGFVVWTPSLLDKIDRIIDAGGEHDVGRPPTLTHLGSFSASYG